MRSVIDEIAAAEQRAEEIRTSAVTQAREISQKAREDAKVALSKLEDTERIELHARLECARKEGEEISANMLSALQQEADAICACAQERLPRAVSYLLDKVTKTA
ncbi:hypothetical protein SDC9_182433 [bioreactor metagenome]|uniref:V-type ATP synthase subunit H n=1 Tax=bioreactor metagenome TaxID=1076179 RepID=A0A645H9Z7_9ZZZZ|nr:hypothetical protein [Christensenella sp.]